MIVIIKTCFEASFLLTNNLGKKIIIKIHINVVKICEALDRLKSIIGLLKVTYGDSGRFS